MDPYRLPRNVVPTRYDLHLEPDLKTFTFIGEETVTLTVREATREILLNAVELAIDRAEIAADPSRRLTATVALDEAAERCRLTFAEPLAPGTWRLHLAFRGTLNDKLHGFYRSSYKDPAGQVHTVAATQFEATDARRAFPCWDEPAFKAVFASTLVIDPGLVALSNTAVREEFVRDGRKVVRFADTIPMSTYLVAFVVGELEATEAVTVGSTPLRVWCMPGKKRLASFGQAIGAYSLKLYEDYYGQPYPGDKLDLISIPDFAAGAMENLGAITFRETALLVDESAATHAELERVADVVAHENAHMWFGDLVTMSWWNGLWLNEAFATFLEMVAVDAWKPEWQRWTTFGASRSAALTVDGLHSTRPIEYPVEAPKDADAMFDVLTYEKGASVLRMMEQYLGPDVFRAGVRLYLERHKFANTETGDLWEALGEASRQPIPAIMDGWVFRAGYPLVRARLEGGQLVLSQQRFTYLPQPPAGEKPSADAGTEWQVPVQIRITGGDNSTVQRVTDTSNSGVLQIRLTGGGNSTVQRRLLRGPELRVMLPAGFEAALVNEGGHGFYRVSYAPELLARLVGRLGSLAAIERFNLVNDAWAAVLAGLMSLADYLDLTARFRGERDKNVWSVLTGSFISLNRILDDADRPRFEALVRDRVGPAAAELGWQPKSGEGELTGQLRGDLLRALGLLGNDADTLAHAAQLFGAHQGDPAAVDANVWAAVIALLGHVADEKRYDDFLARFRSARTPQEEQRYLYALTHCRVPALVEATLRRTVNGEFRTQDAPFLIRALLVSVHGRAAAWRFVQAHWDEMNRLYPATGVRRMCEGIIGLAAPEWEGQVRRFFQERKIDLGGKTLRQYLEQLRVAVALREREGANLKAYLAK
jgi:puromycin-sensitive aminopeptidase